MQYVFMYNVSVRESIVHVLHGFETNQWLGKEKWMISDSNENYYVYNGFEIVFILNKIDDYT